MSLPWRDSMGLLRSLWIYRRPGRQRELRRLYRPFVKSGGLVFDIGAHLGDRTTAFSALGARVVALEPQPALFAWLERFCADRPGVTLLMQAAGAQVGEAELAVARSNPSVATLSKDWRDEVSRQGQGFEKVDWDHRVSVPVTTLDELIRTYGVPDFCKIDVEGFEAEVLAGLSQPLASVSVEFVHASLARTRACIDRLEALAEYRYNVVPGERRDMLWSSWYDADETRAWLDAGADQIPSGDIYARRVTMES